LISETYQLYSFEQDPLEQKLQITPGKSRCYFIVALENGRCELFLSDVEENFVFLSETQVSHILQNQKISYQTWLGEWQGIAYGVILIDKNSVGQYHWTGLRKKLGIFDDPMFMLAGRALQLCQWQIDHRFCGRCGGLTNTDVTDSAKVCEACQLRFYPRISPCMIVAVTRGDEILLAYHKRATRPVYSTLAGFVEAGERLEDCVRREVFEEVGIRIHQPHYLFSQPWPFPSQLMLGFIAEYDTGEINPDKKEILDARWFRYDALPEIPSRASVAGQLIAFFVEQQKNKGTPR
jgi:NAD+ diphosphatase